MSSLTEEEGTIGRYDGCAKETRTRNDGTDAAKISDIKACKNGWSNRKASTRSDGWFIGTGNTNHDGYARAQNLINIAKDGASITTEGFCLTST